MPGPRLVPGRARPTDRTRRRAGDRSPPDGRNLTAMSRPIREVLVVATGLFVVSLCWGRDLPVWAAVLVVALQVTMVLLSVAQAERIAHRIGEPFGTLVLAVSVTVIEVALIVSLMVSEGARATSLARDTVFAAIMIVANGVVGVCILTAARRTHVVRFSEQGANALLGTLLTVATLSLIMPTFTSSTVGPTFTGSQLAFAAVASATVYGVFVFLQSGRFRWMFLSPDDAERSVDEATGLRPPAGWLLPRAALLVASLAVVVGLAKAIAPSVEDAVVWAGAPQSTVGILIAAMILLPETIAAVRAARRGEMQTSINLSLGSALASIGLTIPAIAVASIWVDTPITLGLGGKEIVLLALTAVLSTLTFGSGRATVLQATHHLTVLAAFVFLAAFP